MTEHSRRFDVVVVGGGAAGWSAALLLGRSRRSVLVIDDGHPRNAASRAMHGFASRDGMAPLDFLALARADALRYPGVEARHDTAVEARRLDGGFEIRSASGERHRARKLLLATGVVDELPKIAGIERFYGRSVHHCPYCDGWEHRDATIAVYGRGAKGSGLALMMGAWAREVVLCTDGEDDEIVERRPRLERNGVRIDERRIARLEGDDHGTLRAVVFERGEALACSAMFFNTGSHQRSPLFAQLGCTVDEHGGIVKHPKSEQTDLAGVYVAGDASRDVLLVVVAAAEGAMAAVAINRALRDEDVVE